MRLPLLLYALRGFSGSPFDSYSTCAILYIAYLVYAVVLAEKGFPMISIILLGAIYGLQVIVFLFKREWKQILWMIVYIAAIPVYLPIYAFWHFDDFSWGNTRVVYGEDGMKISMVAEVKKLDPASVPKKTWVEYTNARMMGAMEAKREKKT